MLYPFPPTRGSTSPWGPVQTVTPLGPDVVAVTTASHGGLRVSLTAFARLPEAIRETAYSANGWFEEDCDWALPYLALGLDAFEGDAARAAEVWAAAVRTVQRFHPQHAALLGVTGEPGRLVMGEQAEDFYFSPGVAEAPALAAIGAAADPVAELRERFAAYGASALDEGDTLALILARCLRPGANAVGAADALIARCGGLGRIFGAPEPELARVVGKEAARELGLLHGLLLGVLEHPLRTRTVLGSHEAVKTYLRARLAALPREVFHVLFLDRRNQLIADERLGVGTVDHAPVYPREVARRALELSASAVLLAHNHPSGDPTPSRADIDMTKQVVEAMRTLQIAVHDHFIVAGDQMASLRSLGLM
jgi:DNA repair protein RadC